MIHLDKRYYNKNNTKDVVIVVSIEYFDGLKKVVFRREGKGRFTLPIEMFEKNFLEVDGNQ